MKQSFKTKVKQWWVPSQFRLPEPEFTREQLDLLEELIQLIAPNISRASSATKDGHVLMANFLVDLGTGIWRIRRKIEGLSRMPREIRDAMYSLESMWSSMSEGGVEIVDHIGTIPSAREANIVETVEVQGLAREQVIDAVKPTILLRGEIVQLGEVVMGRPASPVKAAPIQELIPEPVIPAEQDEAAAEEHEPEEMQPPAVEIETFTIEPPLKKWEPLETPESVEAAANIIDESVSRKEEAIIGIIPVHEDDEPRLDSETAIEIDAMESADKVESAEISPTKPEAGPAVTDEKAETDEAEIEIPLPRKAPRRRKSIREAVKQVIQEEPEASAFDDTGRAKRRKMRTASAKQDSQEAEEAPPPEAVKPPRKRRAPKKSEEGEV